VFTVWGWAGIMGDRRARWARVTKKNRGNFE